LHIRQFYQKRNKNGFRVIIKSMKTIDELITDLKLNPEQAQKVQVYMSELVIELLESIKEDNINNFDETIENLKNHTA
jgi:hypothetical protein